MKWTNFIVRWAIILLLAGNCSGAFAQDTVTARAQHIYEQFVAGQGDSIHAALNKELQGQLAPTFFNDSFRQMEGMFGRLKSQGGWKTESAQGITLYYSDLEFERYHLRFLLSFDADGSLNTIRLMPVPEATVAQPVAYDKSKMEERDVTVGADGYKLPGTLTLPRSAVDAGARRVPCVILVHGSGPNDRDETVGPNKPFRDLAWGLAERGIAVLRYDKRTKVYGANCVPEGRELDYDTEAADDAVAIVEQVKAFPEIAADSIFVVGHSLGGTLAPRIAARSKGLAGIISLAGLARPLEDAMSEQFTYISSLTDSSADSQARLDELKQQLANAKNLGTDAFDEKIPVPMGQPRSYWLFANTYKPVRVAATLKLPILVLQGERDYQVTMEDFGLWRAGLLHRKNAFFKSYPKLNHLFQEGSGKATPFEYNEASPIPAYVIDDIASFVKGSRARF
ncbi:MAG: alpha/beta fold hydrolase [Bacteroides sp.]|nr:alpha/beta fold hydrolase [Bacteroides sp.]